MGVRPSPCGGETQRAATPPAPKSPPSCAKAQPDPPQHRHIEGEGGARTAAPTARKGPPHLLHNFPRGAQGPPPPNPTDGGGEKGGVGGEGAQLHAGLLGEGERPPFGPPNGFMGFSPPRGSAELRGQWGNGAEPSAPGGGRGIEVSGRPAARLNTGGGGGTAKILPFFIKNHC